MLSPPEMPDLRNWVWLAVVALANSHEFGTKLPGNFIDFYEPLYGNNPRVSLGLIQSLEVQDHV